MVTGQWEVRSEKWDTKCKLESLHLFPSRSNSRDQSGPVWPDNGTCANCSQKVFQWSQNGNLTTFLLFSETILICSGSSRGPAQHSSCYKYLSSINICVLQLTGEVTVISVINHTFYWAATVNCSLLFLITTEHWLYNSVSNVFRTVWLGLRCPHL